MLSSEAAGPHPNLPSLWSFFNPANPNLPHNGSPHHPGGLVSGPQPQMTAVPFGSLNHVTELANFPQHIELEFEDSVIRKHPNLTNPASTANSNIINQNNATIAIQNQNQQQPQTNNNNSATAVDVMRIKSSPDTIAAAEAASHLALPPPSLANLSSIPLANSTTSASMNSIMPAAISQQGHQNFSEPSYCYLQSSLPQQQHPAPPTCVAQVVTSSTRVPALVPPLTNGAIQPQPFDLSQASTPPFQRCSPDTTSQIPSVSDYSGEYGFTMSYGSSSANVAMSSGKGALWTFSEQTQKLYVKMAATCPVKFQTVHRVPQGCYLRAMSVFKQPEHVKQVVTRCPNHSHGHSKDSFNEGHPAPSHLIRCEHPSAEYQEDAVNGRQSVVVPFDSPQVGTDFVVFLYNFMCYGSCVGGLNRRPIQVVFTLERDGQVLGRRAVEVRICACPSRDRKTEENSLNPAYQGHSRRGDKRGSKALTLRDPMPVALNSKRSKMDQHENLPRLSTGLDPTSDSNLPGGGGGAGDVFYVPVKGLYYYNLVTALYKQLCVHNGDSVLFDELSMGSGNSGHASNKNNNCNQNNQSALTSLTMSSETSVTTNNSANQIKALSDNTECINENIADLNPNRPESPALDETPPVSPIPPSAPDSSHLAETNMISLLSSIGCGYALDCFLSRNILHAGHLSQMSDQELVDMGLDDVTLSKILAAKRDLESSNRQPGDTNTLGSELHSGISDAGMGMGNNHDNACYEQEISLNDSSEQLMIVRTASNSSMTILPNGDLRQTRYTLHHSVSFLKSAGNSFELKPGATLN